MRNEQHLPATLQSSDDEPKWPADLATVINSICGYTTFALSCLSLPLFLPLACILPGGRRYWIAVAMRWAMRIIFASTPTVSWRFGGDVAALKTARVIVSNHEGMLDISAACGLPGYRTLLAKSWVFNAFPLGVAARVAGVCNSDLLTPEAFQEGAALTMPDERIGLFVFPEGRRSRSGKMERFRPGAFVLASHLGVPVVPVVHIGSRQGIRPGSMWIHPTVMRSHVLSPMTPHAEESHRQFAARVRTSMAEARRLILITMLETGELNRHFYHRMRVLNITESTERTQARSEFQQALWQVVTALPAHHGAWLFLGCGWSTMPAVVRLLYPDATILVCDQDAAHRRMAAAWWQRAGDSVVAEITALPTEVPDVMIICGWTGVALKAVEDFLSHHPAAGLVLRQADAEVSNISVTNYGIDGWAYRPSSKSAKSS